MPPTGQDDCNVRDRATFDAQEVQSLIAERRRGNIDRSCLGIPAEEVQPSTNAHFQMPPAFCFSQPSQLSSSWDRVSATSYTQSYSNLDSQEDEHVSYGSEGQFSNPSATQLTLNIPPVHNHEEAYRAVKLDPSFEILSPSFQAWQPAQSRSPDSLGLSPDTLPARPSSAGHALDGGLAGLGLANYVQGYVGPRPYASFNISRDCQGLGAPSQVGYSSGKTGSSTLADLEIPHPLSPSIELSPMDPMERFSMDASSHLCQVPVEVVAGALRRRGKTSTSPRSPRKNLEEINRLRSTGACIKCKLMREQVGCPFAFVTRIG